MTYDTIIKRGQIADGTGGPLFTADIGLIGDRIAAVGDMRRCPNHHRCERLNR